MISYSQFIAMLCHYKIVSVVIIHWFLENCLHTIIIIIIYYKQGGSLRSPPAAFHHIATYLHTCTL